jgi:medium-chain acyl-[acyl-carrier-protein] hydrolase
MTPDPATRWLVRPRPNPSAALRLVCFPYAGGSATVFRTWPDALPPEVELLAVALPGRDARAREPRFDRLTPLVASLADAIGPELRAPFAIFGHSFGSMVGFGLARELQRRSLGQPVHFFASARRAPQLPERMPLHRLSDPDLVAALRQLGGTPDEVFDVPELVEYFLPIVRADIAASETETIGVDAPLSCPITVMGGAGDDRVSVDELDAWRAQTRGPFEREMYPGGHFFLHSDREQVLGSLSRRLTRAIAFAGH